MLYEYLKERYSEDEPIFMSDIDLPVSDNNLRQMFKTLCDSGKLCRYENGIYYIPGTSRLKGSVSVAPETVARYKYISRNGVIDGYYTGYTFANQMGITTQVPITIEIVSNTASARVREVDIRGQKVLLRRPRTRVTEQNYRVLQFLDLLKDIDNYSDDISDGVSERLEQYMKDEDIKQEDIDQYIPLYPDKIYKNFYEMRLYRAIA